MGGASAVVGGASVVVGGTSAVVGRRGQCRSTSERALMIFQSSLALPGGVTATLSSTQGA